MQNLLILLDAIKYSSIEHLHIQSSGVGGNADTKQIKILCDFIKYNKNIKKLDLSGNYINDNDLELLCKAFTDNINLEEIHFYYCSKISSLGTKSIINMYTNNIDSPIVYVEPIKLAREYRDDYSIYNKIKEATKHTKEIKKHFPQYSNIISDKIGKNLTYLFDVFNTKDNVSESDKKEHKIKNIKFIFA